MFSFAELSTSDVVTTFAYWVIVEKKTLPKDAGMLDSLKGWMSYHYDVEEQAYTPKMLRTNKELLIEILGQPIRAERGEGSYSPAICTFEPKFLGPCQPEDRSEHIRHFVFLLRLACSVALQEKGRVTIIGYPGWSYRSWKDDFYMMNPDTALLMHEAGYLYTDRIAQ